jgi:hypothetical protein
MRTRTVLIVLAVLSLSATHVPLLATAQKTHPKKQVRQHALAPKPNVLPTRKTNPTSRGTKSNKTDKQIALVPAAAVPALAVLSETAVRAIAIYIGICGIATPAQCGKKYEKAVAEIQKNLTLTGEQLTRTMNEIAFFFTKIGQDKKDPSIEALRIYNEQLIKKERPKNWCAQQIDMLVAQGRLDVAAALAKLCGLGSPTKSAHEQCNNIVKFDRTNIIQEIEDDMYNFIKNNQGNGPEDLNLSSICKDNPHLWASFMFAEYFMKRKDKYERAKITFGEHDLVSVTFVDKRTKQEMICTSALGTIFEDVGLFCGTKKQFKEKIQELKMKNRFENAFYKNKKSEEIYQMFFK